MKLLRNEREEAKEASKQGSEEEWMKIRQKEE